MKRTKKKQKMENPKLFISYSWSTPEHEQWVLELATELRENNGVDVILDKWDLKEGHDAHVFMEKMVTDSGINKVAIICDQTYAKKADSRKGGVGIETQIISSEVYEKVDQNKFVAVLVECDEDGKAYLPSYYKSKVYIDLSNEDLYAKNFEQLLRWIYDEPLHLKPDLGEKPAFLTNNVQTTSLGTTTKFKRALDAVRLNKEHAKGALNEYFDTFAQNMERFRIKEVKEEPLEDTILKNIEEFIPYRNEAIELFLAAAQYRDNEETHQLLHRFFEHLIPYLFRPEGVYEHSTWDFDNFRFIIHELILYCIASLLKYECFKGVSLLLGQQYYIEHYTHTESSTMKDFTVLIQPLPSLEEKNRILNERRLSLHADLLKQRANATGLKFRQLMQADFVLFLRDGIYFLKNKTYQYWHPETLVYARFSDGAFEVFARAESIDYFNKMKCILGFEDKNDIAAFAVALKEDKLQIPLWDHRSFDTKGLMNLEALATRS